MTLPKIKNKKLIDKKVFIELAKKVQESIKEEMEYLHERKVKNEYHISLHTHPLS